MNCLECGGALTSDVREIRYDGAGLPDVFLSGVRVDACAQCGDEIVWIPQILGLHRALALAVATKAERLDGAEIRMLRKYLGLSGADLAAYLKMAPATVSRWENDKQALRPVHELAVRLLVLRTEPLESYPSEQLVQYASKAHGPVRFDVEQTATSWRIPRIMVAPSASGAKARAH